MIRAWIICRKNTVIILTINNSMNLTSIVKAATHETIPVQSKTSERILRAQIDLFLSQLIQLPIFFSVLFATF